MALACASALAANPPEVDRALAWLAAQPQANGTLAGESGSVATGFQSRAETLVTLKQLGTAPTAVADLVAAEPETTVEYTARKIAALAPLGRDVSASLSALFAAQNADGGFGGAPGYSSDPLDTAYALLALKAASSANATAISKALGYLTSAQSADGSFAIDEQPSVFVTAHALQALDAFAQAYALTAPIQSAKTWLANAQSSGAYSTVLDDSVAALALAGASLDTSLFSGAQAALKGAQSADGSWGGDPYVTALAIRALMATASAPPPATTGQVSGIAVDQSSGSPLSGVQVQLTGAQTAAATTDATGAFSIAGLAPGTYTAQLALAGYTTVTMANVGVTAGVVTNLGTVRLAVATTTASLVGTVRDGTTGQAIAGATVAVSGGPTATTDAAGAYQLSGLVPGAVTITVSATGYQSATVSATLSAGVVVNFSPGLYAPGQGPTNATLKGKVADRASGQAVSGATVTAGSLTATTDATGAFSIASIPPGTVSFQVAASGYVTATVTATLAAGVDDVGTIAIDKQPASVTVSGKVTDSAMGAAIGGATLQVTGTSLTAVTDTTGQYQIAGITQTQFTLAVSAPGYQSRQVAVSLATLVNSVVDVALDKVPASGINIVAVVPDQAAYDPFSAVAVTVSVQNTTAFAAGVLLNATVSDAQGVPVIETLGASASIPAGATTNIELDPHLANQTAGTYTVLVRAFDPTSGSLLAEGSAGFTVNSLTRLSGGITLDPPITQSGTGQAVHITANVANLGNLPIVAGPLALTVTLIDPDTSGTPKAHAEAETPAVSGAPLNSPTGSGIDAQGNFYTVNRGDLRVLKVTPDGQVSVLATLPTSFSSPSLFVQPVDLVADAAGNAYVLNSQSEIFRVATDGTISRIRTNLPSQVSFDRDAAGTFYVVHNNGGVKVARIDASGTQTIWEAEGFSTPTGIVRAPDGNLYVADRSRSAILRLTPQGVVSMFLASGVSVPQGLAVDAAGNLYVGNSGANNVLKVTPQAAVSVYATGFNGPTDLQFDAQGNLFVANVNDNSIAKVPAGGGAAQPFAKTLVATPQGMAYDASGDLYVAGASGQLVRLDPSDNASVVATTISTPRAVATNGAGDVFVANFSNGTITRTSGTTTTTFAAGLASPYGLAFDAAGTLYAAESGSGANRIDAFDASGAKTVAAQSMLTAPQDIYVAPNGDRYVLNTDSIAWTPGAGGPVRIFAQGGFSGTAFAPASDGGFFVAESTSIKRVSPAGVVSTFKTGLPTLANGIVADAAGNLLVADSANKKILRVDTAGNVTTFATLTESPTTIVDDQAGGVYAGTNVGNLVRVSAAGAVSVLTTASVGAVNRLTLDAVGNKLYFISSVSVRSFDLATHAVATVGSGSNLSAVEFAGNGLLLTSATLQLISMTPQGQATTVLDGFTGPSAIASDGAQLYFGDNRGNLYSLAPGGYPHVLVAQFLRHLAWHAGTLYATNGASIMTFTPGVDTAFKTYATFNGTLEGLAFRSDGALSVSLETDSRVLTLDASKQVIASYAGINGPAGVAVDAAGNVYVGSANNSQVLRIAPNGKQSAVFATGISVSGLVFDAAGTLYGASGNGTTRVVRFDATGAQTVVASTPTATGSHGLVVSSDGIFVADGSFSAVRKANGTDLPILAIGLVSPHGVRVDPVGGGVVAASSSNGAVVRVLNGQVSPVAYGLPNATSLAFASTGVLLVGSGSGLLWAAGAPGNATELTNLASVFSGSASLNSMVVDPTGLVYVVDQTPTAQRIERLVYVPATPPPSAGTVVLTRTATFGGLATDSLPAAVDFGTWIPPYGGDFRLSVQAASPVGGEAVNVLHVGPNATGQITAAQANLPPGNSPVGVTVSVSGADFTTLSKVDASNITVGFLTGVTPTAMGADANGNVLFTSSSNGQLRRFSPAGVATTVYTLPTGQTIGMRGMVPVDDQQNAYISGGTSNHDVIRVAPDGTATTIATLTDQIVSLARVSTNAIYALGQSHLFRVGTDGSVTSLPVPSFVGPYALTVDGRDNLYAQFAGNIINMYRPDGTAVNVIRPDATNQPQFEQEGMNISGDCADNLFLTPFVWTAVGQQPGEEHTLVQYVGKTGAAAQILNGLTLNPQIPDLDFIAYDRFSESLLMWTDITGRIAHIPVTCGAISTDLHIVFPAGQPAAGFDVTPKQIVTRADGSTEYVWSFKDVTNLGSNLHFTTTLQNLALGGSAPVASDAFLVFQNSFVAGQVTVPVAIPMVGVDGMVDLGIATDLPQYDANTDVVTTVTLANRDSVNAKSGLLTVQVSDPQGVFLATIAQQQATIPASGSVIVTPPFNTGTFLTGSYVMKATLADPASGLLIATGSAGFDIVAGGATVISSVTTDKQAYNAVDTVLVTSRVRNVSENAIASGLSTRVVVKDPSGQVVLDGTAPVALLVPQALKDSAFTLKLNAAPAGSYTVTETLLDSTGATIETRTTAFAVLSTVDTGSGVRGAVTTTKLANTGDPVTITATVVDQGNAALANLPVTIKVVNPANGQLVQQWSATVSVAQGGQQQVAQIWSTAGTAAGAYIAAASVTFGGREIVLGQDTITIGAIQPFAFAPKTNVAVGSVVESDPITVAGIVAPAPISISVGEYRIGAGGWTGAAGFVNPGDVVTVRVTASNAFNTTTTATLAIAGFSAPFSVTTVNPDVTPDAFAFTPLSNVPLTTLETSNTVTITGIDIPVPISIAGGEYSVNGGAWTSAAGTIGNNDTVAVRLTSSSALGTTTTATLTVSGVTGVFNVTTTAEDRTPDAFAFAPQNGVPVSTLRTSNTVTITGINVAVPIGVVGGEYSINGGAFTSAAGTVAAGNTVTVRHSSAATFSTTVTTRLTVSDFTASFESTTEGEDRSPDAFAFAAQTDVPLSAQRVSNPITVTGINTTVPISIAGGEYSLNGAAYTSAAGTVQSNDQVIVRQTSAVTFATTTTATLTVSDFSAPFAVTTKAKADVATTPRFAGDERVLVLVSCKLNGLEDADDDAACVAQRVPFLDSYLNGLGVLHRIVTTTLDFKAEMRSGRYDAYWVSGGAKKLLDDLAEEIREAAFRGETVIVDGVHDQRNGDLDEAVGVAFRGKPTGVTSATMTGATLPAGTFAVAGTKPIRVLLTTGLRQARFNTGDPAIATNAYGSGDGLLFAFDLVATLMAQPTLPLLHDVVDGTLAMVTPAVPQAFSGGAYVPLTITVRNAEPVAVDLTVTATLPAGFSLEAGAPPATVSGSTVTWNQSLAAGASQDIDWSVRVPNASGSYTIAIALTQVYGTTSVADGTASIPIQVNGLDAALPAVIAQLQALSLSASDAVARDAAVASLQAAQGSINVANWEQAIAQLVDAVGKLDNVNAVATTPYRAAIDGVLKEVEERWWAALPACPATPPCRTP